MAFLLYIIIGAGGGLLAHYLVPRMKAIPDSLITTLLLGALGGVVGGLIGGLVDNAEGVFTLNAVGVVSSVIGTAIVLVAVYFGLTKRRRVHA